MITQEDFDKLCKVFSLKYSKTKKNITSINGLSSALNSPIEEEITKTNIVACKPGCSHCCYLRVEAFPHEIVSIYHFLIKTMDQKQLTNIKQKISEQFLKIENFSIDEHFKTNIECPLLVNNQCSVHKVRPVACAGYHSMSEAQCIKSYNQPEVVDSENGNGLPMVASINEKLSIQTTVAIRVIESCGDDKNKYELIKGLNHIFKNPSIIQKWRNGHTFIK